MMCGAFTPGTEPADQEVKDKVLQMKANAETEAGRAFELFEAVCYRTQVVAGTNYMVKVRVGGDEFIHVKIYETLPYAG